MVGVQCRAIRCSGDPRRVFTFEPRGSASVSALRGSLHCPATGIAVELELESEADEKVAVLAAWREGHAPGRVRNSLHEPGRDAQRSGGLAEREGRGYSARDRL